MIATDFFMQQVHKHLDMLKIPALTAEQISVVHRFMLDARVTPYIMMAEQADQWDLSELNGMTSDYLNNFILRNGGVAAEDIHKASKVSDRN